MKLIIDTPSLVEAINWVAKSFDTKNDKAFISLFIDEDGNGSLTHENATSFLKSELKVLSTELEDEKSLELALEGRYLQRLASALSRVKSPVELSKKSASAGINVKSSLGTLTIPIIDAVIPKENKIKTLGEIDDNEYFDTLQKLSKLCDTKNAGFFPVLETIDVQFKPSDNKVFLMATDRYALGEIILDFTPNDKNDSFFADNEHLFLPYDAAVLITPSKNPSPVSLVYDEKTQKFGYSFIDGRVALFALKQAEPLEYDGLKAKGTEIKTNYAIVNLNNLKSSISTLSALAWEENDVYLEIGEKSGFKITDSARKNVITVDVDTNDETAFSSDEEYRIKFTRNIINEAFSPIGTENIKIRWESGESPFIFDAVLSDGTVSDNVFVLALPSN